MDSPEAEIPVTAPDLRVGIVLVENFTFLPFSCLIECLRHAADEGDRSRQRFCTWALLSPDLEPVRASCGFSILPQVRFGDPSDFDYIVVVAGLLPMASQVGEEVRAFLRTAHTRKVPIVGLDNGTIVLSQLGLLDGRDCAIHFFHRLEMQAGFPQVRFVTDKPFIDLGDIITCPGGVMALDLAVHLISRHCGKARAQKGLRLMIADTSRLLAPAPHMPYSALAGCGDWRVTKAIELMESNIGFALSVEEIARRLGIGAWELNRAFKRHTNESPSAAYRTMRLAHAHWLVLNTSRTITEIAFECGFLDAAHFSRWFKRTYQSPPSEFRKTRLKATRFDAWS